VPDLASVAMTTSIMHLFLIFGHILPVVLGRVTFLSMNNGILLRLQF
jgi:hypothetical protein